jgi:hypothetical protein
VKTGGGMIMINHYKIGGHVNNKNFMQIIAFILFLSISGIAYCGNDLSYDGTVNLIKDTMASSTSDYRKESYGYIRFNNCSLDFNVFGTYPVGDLYNIKFSNIDFSSLNYQVSKIDHDYTAFIILNFNNSFQSKDDSKDLTIRTVVINVSTDDKAQILFKAFLHLGELCGAQNKFKN